VTDRQTDRQTDGQTDGIAMAYTRYSIYAVAHKNPLTLYRLYSDAVNNYLRASVSAVACKTMLVLCVTGSMGSVGDTGLQGLQGVSGHFRIGLALIL